MRARAVAASMALSIVSLAAFTAVPASAVTQTTWNVQVGGGDFQATGLNRFYLSDITVHPGDLVNFNWAGFHTVTFNPPAGKSVLDYAFPPGLTGSTTLETPTTFVNGSLAGVAGGPGSGPPPPFTLTIGANLPNGTYHYQCMLHQYMRGSIRVTRGELPSSDAENLVHANAQMAADLARAAALDARLTRRGNENQGEALVGGGNRVADFYKYYPSSITVHAGDEVTFKHNDPHDPHSITFGYANAKPPLSPPAELFASAPSPATYSGGDLNSGYLSLPSQFKYWHLAGVLPGFTQRAEYTIKFTKPGTYPFYCTLHGGIAPDGTVGGMSGSVTVLPAADNGDNGGH
jgi:plastocyanin